MKKLIPLIVIAAGLAFGNAYAAKEEPAPAKPKTKQQIKMAGCNKDAKEKSLKGAERKKFMSTCLKA